MNQTSSFRLLWSEPSPLTYTLHDLTLLLRHKHSQLDKQGADGTTLFERDRVCMVFPSVLQLQYFEVPHNQLIMGINESIVSSNRGTCVAPTSIVLFFLPGTTHEVDRT